MTIRLGNKIISGGGSSGVPGWTGTLAEYNALTEIDDEMLYYITDDCLDSNSNHLGGLDIGDIGFTALGVNEELNCRRYLNGQVLAMDEFPEFTSKLKHAVSLNSSIAVDEDVWQTELAMSANGICYKFVIDDNNMAIRLPKYPEYFIAGLSDSTGVAGNGKTLGFTDGSLEMGSMVYGQNLYVRTPLVGLNVGTNNGNAGSTANNTVVGVSKDPSKSGIEALVDSASEKVYGFYFIQVANGLEQTVDITREITLNNPFFLGMYQYFEVEPNNISWLKSEGQWNSAEVYPGMWEWLLEEREKGLKQLYGWTTSGSGLVWTLTETPAVGDPVIGYYPRYVCGEVQSIEGDSLTFASVVTSTVVTYTRDTSGSNDLVGYVADDLSVPVYLADEMDANNREYDFDYDFIIDRVTNTFRLPIKVKGAAGKAVVGNGMTVGLTDGNINTGLYAGDFGGSIAGGGYILNNHALSYGTNVGTTSATTGSTGGMSLGITTDPNYSGIETSTDGLHLYFYVGETVQDPTLINVGRLTHALSLKTDMGQAAHAGMPSNSYIGMTLGTSGSTYVAPADGYFCINKGVTASDQYVEFIRLNGGEFSNKYYGRTTATNIRNTFYVGKGDTIQIVYTAAGATHSFAFTYANGSQPTN